MKVLALGAHPDDIEIFMLGILLCYKKKKDQIFLAVATDGAAGNVLGIKDLANVRKLETQDNGRNVYEQTAKGLIRSYNSKRGLKLNAK